MRDGDKMEKWCPDATQGLIKQKSVVWMLIIIMIKEALLRKGMLMGTFPWLALVVSQFLSVINPV